MYKGNVTIPAENYERVAQVAEQLEMKDFRKLKIESETERKFPQNFLNDDKLKTKTKIDVNKIVADYPDVSVKTKCQTDVEEEESDESHDEEPKIVTSQPQKINLACKICKKTFQKVKQLTLHVKSHSGKKPYVCNFCPAGFKRSSHLTRHKLIHTGEKPHSCTACDKSFSRLDKLKQHNRNTHNNDNIRTVTNVVTRQSLQTVFCFQKRPLEEEVSGSRKRQKGRPRKFSDEKEANYDITNLPFGDLSYLTMPDPAMNPMEPLVEIKTSETAGSLKLKDTPRAEIKTEGSLVKIGECIVSMTGNNT